MRLRRSISLVGVWLAGATLALPVLAVPLGAIVDRSPGGASRLTAFPLALTITDDLARQAIRDSVLLAATVASLSLGIGLGLARLRSLGSYPGREGLVSLARISGAIPPLFAATGLLGLQRLVPVGREETWRWLALAWVELAWSVPRVMRAANSATDQVTPGWLDAARLAGASRRRAWWSVVWPMGRPGVARAVATIFTQVLFEPGAPLVLGVRSTLSVQIVESVLGVDSLSRAASLAVIGLAIGTAGYALLLWWGGPSWTRSHVAQAPPSKRASWFASGVSIATLLTWVAFALLPIAALAAVALGLDRTGRLNLDAFSSLVADRDAVASLGHGLILGIAATLGAFSLALATEGGHGRAASWRRPATWPALAPPLAIGVGAVLLPTLLEGVRPSSAVLRHFAGWLDPYRSPWLVLIVAVALPQVPRIREALVSYRSRMDRDRLDVARALGASPWVAWRDVRGRDLAAILGGAFAWSVATAALDAGPALLLSPTLAARPITPAVMSLTSEPGGLRLAAAMATIALILPILAWILGGDPTKPASTVSGDP